MLNQNDNEKRSRYSSNNSFRIRKNLIKFCQGIKKGSPIDSCVIPEPSEMGGYEG